MDSYRIAVQILLSNGVSPVLAIIGRDLLGLNTSIKAIEKNFGGWTAALIGVGSILTGATILGAMTKLVEASKEFQDELIKIQRLGGPMGAMAASGELSKQAFSMAQRVPMKVEDLLKIPGDINSILGPAHSMEVWEPLARYEWVSKRNGGQGDANALRDLIRGGEMSGRIYGADGQIDPKKLEQYIDDVTKATAATHGMVNPATVLALAQQGGPALRGLDEHGFLTLLVQSQAMGGHRAGTAYLSLWQQLAGGTMFNRTAHGMEEMGFLKPGDWSSAGGRVTITPEASKRLLGLISKDPLAFAGKINEELAKRGITDPAEQMQAVMRMTGRQTTQRFTAEEVIAFKQMKAEIERLQQGLGVGSSFDLYRDKSISGAQSALGNAWHNLIVAMGGPEGEHFAAFLNKLTGAINGVMGAVNKLSSNQIDMIFKIITGIGAGLVVIGGISLAALIGLPALIAGAVAALATLAVLQWGKIKEDFAGIGAAISSFIDSIAALYNRVKSFLSPTSLPGSQASPNAYGNWTPSQKLAAGMQPVSFNPGMDRNRSPPISLSLNVDGRTLAQSISNQLDSLYRYDTNTPAFNGTGRYGA